MLDVPPNPWCPRRALSVLAVDAVSAVGHIGSAPVLGVARLGTCRSMKAIEAIPS
ncbi:hypothetical protein ACIA74_39805 [Streptomyces sp. NPDC051658]|uniref:hypothetical protein n=1 Tax=Streptomyces sp. NPDC051658 TaxID=3365667 RepID=UPI0037992D95